MHRTQIDRANIPELFKDSDGSLDVDAELGFLFACSNIGMCFILDVGIDSKGRFRFCTPSARYRNEIFQFRF